MAGTLNKVKSGDPLVIPAATFNTFIDAARDYQERQRATRVPRPRAGSDRTVILVRNETGVPCPRCGVIGLHGPLINRADNAVQFLERVALRGALPSAALLGRFAILLEPLAPQAIGRACIAGVTLVQVRMAGERDLFADLELGDVTRLRSGAAGGAQLLWTEPPEARDTPSIAWALVRLGGGGATAVVVEAQLVGGSPGGAALDCSWVYDYWLPEVPLDQRSDATKLNRTMEGASAPPQMPRVARWPLIEYEQADPATYKPALAIHQGGVWQLWQVASERPRLGDCDCPPAP